MCEWAFNWPYFGASSTLDSKEEKSILETLSQAPWIFIPVQQCDLEQVTVSHDFSPECPGGWSQMISKVPSTSQFQEQIFRSASQPKVSVFFDNQATELLDQPQGHGHNQVGMTKSRMTHPLAVGEARRKKNPKQRERKLLAPGPAESG